MPATHPLEIVSHRGASDYAPENTYASAQICLDWGMDYIEVDINTSKDGVLYVFHGPGLSRTTNSSGLITQCLAAEIDQLDAGSWFDPKFVGERLPTNPGLGCRYCQCQSRRRAGPDEGHPVTKMSCGGQPSAVGGLFTRSR